MANQKNALWQWWHDRYFRIVEVRGEYADRFPYVGYDIVDALGISEEGHPALIAHMLAVHGYEGEYYYFDQVGRQTLRMEARGVRENSRHDSGVVGVGVGVFPVDGSVVPKGELVMGQDVRGDSLSPVSSHSGLGQHPCFLVRGAMRARGFQGLPAQIRCLKVLSELLAEHEVEIEDLLRLAR